MTIAIAVVSILAVSALVWLANRALPFTVCPICAGVFLTWAGLIGAHFAGYRVDLLVPALLMGGSVVGIAYQLAPLEARPLTGLEKKSGGSSLGARLLFKALFIPTGFVAAYAVLAQWWAAFLVAAALLAALALWLVSLRGAAGPREETVGNIEKKMKDCC